MMKNLAAAALALVCFLSASLCTGQPSGGGAPPAPGFRVGTFDQQSIVVAYYRSSVCAELLRELKAARDAAAAAGDTARVAELEKQGAALQELAHNQLEGKVPIDNIVERTKKLMPQIAGAAKVDVIVIGKVVYPVDAQAVDVTEQYLAALKADEATRKVIAELKAKQKK